VVPNVELAFSFLRNPAKLGESPYALFFLQKIQVIQDKDQPGCWCVKTLSYEYNIERLDDSQEVICFHWEGKDSNRPDPHIHIGFAAKDFTLPIGPKHHIPCGRVAVEDVVTFLVGELGIKPLPKKHSTWKDIVAAAKSVFVTHKNW
jgi:hypothetical protein